MKEDPFLIAALVAIGMLFVIVVAAIVFIGSLPGKIAKKRNHPQVDAVNAASWIGLAALGALWPIAFVWAFWSYDSKQLAAETPPDKPPTEEPKPHKHHDVDLKSEIEHLKQMIVQLDSKLTHSAREKSDS